MLGFENIGLLFTLFDQLAPNFIPFFLGTFFRLELGYLFARHPRYVASV